MEGLSYYEAADRLIHKYHTTYLSAARNRCRLMRALLQLNEHKSLDDDARKRLGQILSGIHADSNRDKSLCDELEEDREKLDAKMHGETLGIKVEQSDANAEIEGLSERLEDEQWNCKEAWKQIEGLNQLISGLAGSVTMLETQLSKAKADAERDKQEDVPQLRRRITDLEAQLHVSSVQVRDLNQRNYTLQVSQYQNNSVLHTQYSYIHTANQNIQLVNFRYSEAVRELQEKTKTLAEKDSQLKAEQETVAELRKELDMAKLRQEKVVPFIPVRIINSEESSHSLPFIDEEFELVGERTDE